MRMTKGEKAYQVFNYLFIILVSLIMIFPIWHVFMFSLSHPNKVFGGGVFFYPREFSTLAYITVLRDPLILSAYKNTIFVVLTATFINIVLSFLMAYPLSKKDFRGKTFLSFYIFFTMLFSGGLIPFYLVVRSIGLLNSLWSLVIPSGVSAYFIFVLRNFIKTIPDSLAESAKIDGANEFIILFRIIIPLSKPAMAVLALMYGVGHWNSWFNCIIFINNTSKYTLQPILRIILMDVLNSFNYHPDLIIGQMPEVIKMTTVMVATIPILMVYPFLQKYFIKGMMIGSVKG